MIAPDTVVNFALAVAIGRFISDVAYRYFLERTGRTEGSR